MGRPSSIWRLAPPPVEMCEKRSASPNASAAAAVSPPPTMVTAPSPAAPAIATATSLLPTSKGGVSNTPTGPFHTMVPAWWSSSMYWATVSGPRSNPIQPASIDVLNTLTGVTWAICLPQM